MYNLRLISSPVKRGLAPPDGAICSDRWSRISSWSRRCPRTNPPASASQFLGRTSMACDGIRPSRAIHPRSLDRSRSSSLWRDSWSAKAKCNHLPHSPYCLVWLHFIESILYQKLDAFDPSHVLITFTPAPADESPPPISHAMQSCRSLCDRWEVWP